MGAFQNIGMNDYIKRYGFKNAMMRGIFMANPFHIVKDYENKKILYYRKARKYIERRYYHFANCDVTGIQYGACQYENVIWVYWKQGFENAPPIVQRCVKSIEKYSEMPVIKLDQNNIENYVRLPQDILQKYHSGNMSDAALSDLIRFALLEHFGGTWLDATVLLTGKIPSYILESDFFAFRDNFGLIENPALLSTWLLHSRAHNDVVRMTRNIVFAYWRKEKYVVEYLMIYIMLQLVCEKNRDLTGWFPYANSDYCHQYLNALDAPFCEKMLTHITAMSSIHKMSYKLKESVLTNTDNFYAKLISEE